MRLTPQEQEALLKSFQATYGASDHIWLFGSRADDSKRGGDIDLYIETNLPTEEAIKAKFKFLRILQDAIGEQKIDIVLNVLALKYHQPIYEIAKRGYQFL